MIFPARILIHTALTHNLPVKRQSIISGLFPIMENLMDDLWDILDPPFLDISILVLSPCGEDLILGQGDAGVGEEEGDECVDTGGKEEEEQK
jgi:hypothetical protein